MSEDVKIYHVETLEDYNDLMVKLEEQGYRWRSGELPTYYDKFWYDYEMNTCIQTYEYDKSLTYGSLRNEKCKETIVKHKARGVEQMEKVVVPRCVANWYEEFGSNDLHKTLDRYLNNFGTNESLVKWEKSFGGTHRNNLNNAQDTLAKMHLYDYEVEEKKYHWRKKKEHMLDFEYYPHASYINLDADEGVVSFDDKEEDYPYLTKFTELEIIDLLGEEDFKKLERVEFYE